MSKKRVHDLSSNIENNVLPSKKAGRNMDSKTKPSLKKRHSKKSLKTKLSKIEP